MACPSYSQSDIDRNINTIDYPKQTFNAVIIPEVPFKMNPFPYIDTRQVRIRNPLLTQNVTIEVPNYTMRYSMGCTNCIRNSNLIFAP